MVESLEIKTILLPLVFQIEKSARLVGYFVPLSSSFPLIVTGVTSTSSVGPLKVLRNIVADTKLADLELHVDEIGNLLADKDICQTLNTEKQKVLMDVGLEILNRASEVTRKSEKSAKNFFRLGITVFSMAKDSTVAKKSNGIFFVI